MPEAGWPPMGMFGFKEIPKEQTTQNNAQQNKQNE
jgi:hypothetical protein